MDLRSITRPPLPLAVVVGAGGMAQAIARRIGTSHELLLADRDPGNLARAARQLRNEGHVVDEAICDVTDADAVAALAGQAAALGRVRALVHVVGLSPSMADGRRILEVNLRGALLVARAFEPAVTAGHAAVFISSLAAHLYTPDAALVPILDDALAPDWIDRLEAVLGGPLEPTTAYMLSKWAMMRMCRRLAAPWGRHGGRIISLSPGLIATPMGIMEFNGSPAKLGLLDASPLARQGSMLEIAEVVDFLISDRASFISGTDILVDGGVAAAIGAA